MTVRKTPVVRRVAPPGPGQRLPAPSHARGTRRARSHAHSTRTAHHGNRVWERLRARCDLRGGARLFQASSVCVCEVSTTFAKH